MSLCGGDHVRFRVLVSSSLWVLFTAANASAAGSDLADAVMNRNKAEIRSLFSHSINVSAPQADGATALHWAVRWDDAELVDQLIRAGADVNAANRLGATPMYLACVNGNAAIIGKLIAAGADPNGSFLTGQQTPLMTAAQTGKVDAVRALVDS